MTGGAGGLAGAAGVGGVSGAAGAGGMTGEPLAFADNWVGRETNRWGIQGSLYTFKDACPTTLINWDPITRCATGTTSDPGPTWECWGLGVAFDFNNSGGAGSPANAINHWDAIAAGANGVSWVVTGNAPGLEVWVRQADMAKMPDCLEEECYIVAPPDGMANAPLAGSMTWDQMVKADWGDVGVQYTFDPTQILGVEFMIPAVPGGAAVDFCVESIGILEQS